MKIIRQKKIAQILLGAFFLTVLFGAIPTEAQTLQNFFERLRGESGNSSAVEDKVRINAKRRLISIVKERADILHSRWEALADRLEKISARIESRLSKMENGGFDGTTARALLQNANDRVQGARLLSEDAYKFILNETEKTDGSITDLRRIEFQVINPEKEAVNTAFERARNSFLDVLEAIP